MGCPKNNFGQRHLALLGKAPLRVTAERRLGSIPPSRPFSNDVAAVAGWQIERALTLHRICLCIAKRIENGQSFEACVRLFNRRWTGKHYRRNPDRPFLISRATLIRTYYRWKANGRSPDAVKPKFARGRKPTQSRAVALLESASSPTITSQKAAFMAIHSPECGFDGYRRALSSAGLMVLAGVFDARRRAISAERRLAKLLAEYGAQNVQ